MATKFFLRDDLAAAKPDSQVHLTLETIQGDVEVFGRAATQAGPIGSAGVQMTEFSGGRTLDWITLPLEGITISGTITIQFMMRESNLLANVGAQARIFRTNINGVIISEIANSEKGTELSTTTAAQAWNATPTTTVLQTTDRIMVRVCGNDAGGNMASGRTFDLSYEGPAGPLGKFSFVQFTENITQIIPTARLLPILGVGN